MRNTAKIMKKLDSKGSVKLDSVYSQDLQSKKTWYSSAVRAYDRTRPSYPQAIINRVLELAQISRDGRILEIGCGSGNATVAFAQMSFSLLCLEPNQDFCWLARQNCREYSHVEILNTSFEEWSEEAEAFDAILAATAIHWVSPEIAYPKAANALKENGSLILLWNVIPEPSPGRYNSALEIYQTYAPSITAYEDQECQRAKLKGIEDIVINSGKFIDLVSGWMECQAVYSIDDYLALLSTLSPYLKLEEHSRELLFEHLRESMEQEVEDSINVSYLSAFQVARKYNIPFLI